MSSTAKDLKSKIHEIIYEANTFWGKFFDISLLIAIVISVVIVMLDSIPSFHNSYGNVLYVVEWSITILFTLEYLLRIYCLSKPKSYILSTMGIIDLLAILPSYISILFPGTQYLMVVRALRLIRVFRIFKLFHYLAEARFLATALLNSFRKISLFLMLVVIIVIIVGSFMYLIEGPNNGFDSIPSSIYWCIVTVTTVGFGDIVPITTLGKIMASFLMLCGYSIIAVPTGIVTTEMALTARNRFQKHVCCENCGNEDNEIDANFCKKCGHKL